MIIDGKKISEEILSELKEKIKDSKVTPTLAVILIGENSASEAYVNRKIKAGAEIGAKVKLYRLDTSTSMGEVTALIEELNQDNQIQGIILQLPIPEHLSKEKLLSLIEPQKDVDGLVPESPFSPATALGVLELLKRSDIQLEGAEAVVVGRSDLVGKPTAWLLLQENATVTICHSKTKDMAKHTKEADILVVAIGKPKFITAEMVKEGAVVIDVGINKLDNELAGDVDFEAVKEVAGLISPVPGGVGPMTVAMLMSNLVKAALNN